MKRTRIIFHMLTFCLLVCSNHTVYAESRLEPVLTYMHGPGFNVVSSFSEGLMPTEINEEIEDKPCYIDESGAIAVSYEKLKSLLKPELSVSQINLGEFDNGTALISEIIPTGESSARLEPLFYIDRSGNIVSEVEKTTYNPYVNYPSIHGNYFYLEVEGPVFTINNFVNSDVIYLDKTYRPNYNIYDEKMSVVNEKTGKHGYIDKTGKVVIECKFDWAYPFINGYALTQTGGVYKFIDTNGNYISDLEWKSGFMNCVASCPNLLFQFDDGINEYTGIKLVRIELAEIKDGIIHRPVKIFINNELIRLDEQPQIVDGRVVVSVKSICDALDIHYLIDNGTLTINYENRVLTNKIAEENFSVNGITENYGVKSYLRDNNIFIPIKAINNLLEADISWDSDSKTITLNY